jgi:hypothetical protein
MSIQRLTELMERLCDSQGVSRTGRQFTSEYLSVVVPIGASASTITVKTLTVGKKQFVTFLGGTTGSGLTISDWLFDNVGVGAYMAPATYYEKKFIDLFGSPIPCDTTIKVTATNTSGAEVTMSFLMLSWTSDE